MVPGPITATVDNQILVELARGDIGPRNLFDLDGQTIVFTPDGHGRYSRSARSLAWEEDIGLEVDDRAEIRLRFVFDFAGRRWDSFFVSHQGLITFGEPLAYEYWDAENRFNTMDVLASKFVNAPTISPLHKPALGAWGEQVASQYVASWPDRVVVTWATTDPEFYVYGAPPAERSRFQLVLRG